MDYQKKYLKFKNKYIILKKQLAGNNHEKYIYPKNMVGFNDLNKYSIYNDYYNMFIKYLQDNNKYLCNLWLVIGATNQNINQLNDLDRFGRKYDISINGDYKEINIRSPDLISLSNDYTMNLNYYEESIVYEDIYTILNEYLQEKF